MPYNPTFKQRCISVDDETFERARAKADEMAIGLSGLIRIAIREYTAKANDAKQRAA